MGMIRHLGWRLALPATLLFLILLLSPLPFGSVMPKARVWVQVAAFAAWLLCLAGRKTLPGRASTLAPAVAIAGIGAWGILQSLPWPRPLVALLAPRLLAAWGGAEQLLGAVAEGGVALSIAPGVSRSVGLHWLAVAACLAAAAVVSRDRPCRRLLSLGFLAIVLFEVFFGLDNWLANRGTIWGIDVPGGGSRLRGTYINSDHMAFYLAIALCSAFAWLWWAIRRIRRWVSRESWMHLVASLLLFLLLFVSLAFTGSRAAMVAVGTALLFQTAILAAHYRNWRVGAYGLGVLTLGFATVAFLNLQQGLGRWLNTSAYEVTLNSRLETYSAAFEIFRLFPYTGSGLGTFRQAFPWVQPADLKGSWVHAHNDILEILVTTGALGFLILVAGLVFLLHRLVRTWRGGRRSEDRAVVLAALGSLWAVLAHSMLDFGFSLPSNACTLAILLGAACGVPIRRWRGGERALGEASGRGDVEEADPPRIDLPTSDYP